jgi:hypothetical protein
VGDALADAAERPDAVQPAAAHDNEVDEVGDGDERLDGTPVGQLRSSTASAA